MRGRDNRWSRGGRVGNRHGGFKRGGFGRGGPRGGYNRGRGFGGHRDGNRFNSNNQGFNRPMNEIPEKRLTEDQIGVTEYMGDHEGFTGIIKSRYSDFQVSEINLSGEVAQLTNMSAPKPEAEKLVEEDEELLLNKYNVEILPMETWDKIGKVASGNLPEGVEIDVTTATKEDRTKIHEAVKKAFAECIVGSTVTKDDKKFVKFEKYKKGVRVDNRVKWTWPGEFVHFLVHKENCDTMDAATKIAERMRSHIKPSMLGYAGTKDRRAKTTQWFSIRKVDPRKIAAACRDMRELRVGNYCFRDRQLKLGMLKGNKFRIALRNVTADDSVVEAACSRLAERGFINYYGLQRFGSRMMLPTYEVGKRLLKGNLQEAIDCILSAHTGSLQATINTYKSCGAAVAANSMPKFGSKCMEGSMIQALADHPNDLYNAMQRVPRNTRLLYLHSYQSLVWNRCVSERVRRGGLRPAVGDLVPLQPDTVQEEPEAEESDSEETEHTDKQTDGQKPDTNTKFDKNKPKEKVLVKVLTQEDIDAGNYSIFDIVLPLPGYSIEYPPNMKDYYEQLLTSDGLTLQLRHKHRSYSMSGAYRHLAVKPTDVTWRCVRYTEPYCDLILSDVDLMQGRKLTGIVDNGAYKALLLSFTLPLSCYATMLLRELLRTDTSAHSQALHNNYHTQGQRKGAATGGGDNNKSGGNNRESGSSNCESGGNDNEGGEDNCESGANDDETGNQIGADDKEVEKTDNKRKAEEDGGGDEKRMKESE